MTTPSNAAYMADEPAELTQARVEQLKQAAKKDQQQAEYFKQQARYHEAQADRATTDKAINEIRLQNEKYSQEHNRIRYDEAMRAEQIKLAESGFHGTFEMKEAIRDGGSSIFGTIKGTVDPLVAKLNNYSKLNPGAPIEIIFDSPGGSIRAGMRLYNFIHELKARGHFITCGTRSMAASMAGVLLQAGDNRWMGREALLLIHEGSAGAVGTIGQMQDQFSASNKMRSQIVKIFIKRSGGKITKKDFLKRWDRKDWWLDAKEAKKHGFIDEIR